MGFFKFIKNLFDTSVKCEQGKNLPAICASKSEYVVLGRKLIVKENQIAFIFVRNRIYDIFKEGEHELSLAYLPKVTQKLKLDKPRVARNGQFIYARKFKGRICFINLEDIINKVARVPRFLVFEENMGKLRIQLLLMFNYKIINPNNFAKFIAKSVGYNNIGYLDSYISRFIGKLAFKEVHKSSNVLFEMYAKDKELALRLQDYINERIERDGWQLSKIEFDEVILRKKDKQLLDKTLIGKELDITTEINTESSLYYNNESYYQLPTSFDEVDNLDNINESDDEESEYEIKIHHEKDTTLNDVIKKNHNYEYENYNANLQKTICPLCGQEMPISLEFCLSCGTNLKKGD